MVFYLFRTVERFGMWAIVGARDVEGARVAEGEGEGEG